MAKQPDIASLDKLEGAKCSMASMQPLLVDWSSTRRGALESALRRGTVVVRYTGCDLKVLDACRTPTHADAYAYVPINPKHEGHNFHTTDDLYAQMPMAAARFEGELKSSGELRLDMSLVGRFESQTDHLDSAALDGTGCDEATHFVRAVSVGAFRLLSAAAAEESGSVAMQAGGVRAHGSAEKESLSEEGDPKACESASSDDTAPPDRCAGLIRLKLVPIASRMGTSVVKRERVCPPGMTMGPDESCVESEEADEPGSTGNRFVIEEETAFDTVTGLTWQRQPAPDRMSWEGAKQYCRSLGLGGSSGWRLPKPRELGTLLERGATPAIDGAVFPNTPSESFWTFAPDRSSPGDAIAIDFAAGKVVSQGSGTRRSVRCVR